MSKKDYSKESWWHSLTRKEKEEILRLEGMEDQEIGGDFNTECEQPNKEKPSQKKHFKAIDLFGWG